MEKIFRNRWNVPHSVGALDGKDIAIKKPKKSGSECFNYKGYFSLVMLALVNAVYKFLWVNVGASCSSSDAQIFNHTKLRRKIENHTVGLPPPEPLNLHYFLLGDDAFALMLWLVKPYSGRQLTREERIANSRISRGRRVVKKTFGILVGRFMVLLTTTEQRPKVVSFIYFIYLFGVLRCFQHCTGHITTGSWKGRGNQYIQFIRVPYCKLPTNGKQLPAFPLEAVPGIEPRPQRWEARVLPLCHHGP